MTTILHLSNKKLNIFHQKDILKAMKNSFEKKAWASNSYVCGIDEAGRGCLFGPLVAACAIVPPHTKKSFLKDSKQLSAKEREQAYTWITQHCIYAAVFIKPHTIDNVNIYNATKKAMIQSFMHVAEMVPNITRITHLVTDAMPLTIPAPYMHNKLHIHSPIKAESISCSVAAASIIAKVTRDRFIKRIAHLFNTFDIAKHKGYGTKDHVTSIQTNGLSVLHRKTFVVKLNHDHRNQQTIF